MYIYSAMRENITISSSTKLNEHLEWFMSCTEKDVADFKRLVERKNNPIINSQIGRLLKGSTDRGWTKK